MAETTDLLESAAEPATAETTARTTARTAATTARTTSTTARTTPPLPMTVGCAHAGPGSGCALCPARPGERCGSGAFSTDRERRRYRIVLLALALVAGGLAFAHLAWDNPMPVGSEGFWLIAQLRATSLIAMITVAVCQAFATVAFQTVTENRILTPSIMGFESLYVAIQTASVYAFGVAGVSLLTGTTAFAIQIAAMIGLSLALYGWLLTGKRANLQVMLLSGIVIGGGLGSVSTFMQRLLTPSEFDVLTARMFGSVTKADPAYFPLALPLAGAACLALWLSARRLNLMALGRDACVNLGVDHRRQTRFVLVAVSVLMAVSTALVGPMTFFGFLTATLARQLVPTFDHRRLLPVAALLGFVILSGAYVVMTKVFYAQGVVSIIVELVGGSVFLLVILRKGRLQ